MVTLYSRLGLYYWEAAMVHKQSPFHLIILRQKHERQSHSFPTRPAFSLKLPDCELAQFVTSKCYIHESLL